MHRACPTFYLIKNSNDKSRVGAEGITSRINLEFLPPALWLQRQDHIGGVA